MRRLVVSSLSVLVATLLGIVAAQSFSGTFVSTGGEMSVAIQQNQDGSLSGFITGQTGQYQLQGQASGTGAYGVADSQQGLLGFQAQLSADGQTMQLMFYQADANNQPTPVSPLLVLNRQGAMGDGGMGGMPPQAPGGIPGQVPGGMPGQVPAQAPGGFPGQMPGQVPGGMPGQMPGQMPGGMPPQAPGGFPGQQPAQMPGGFPGQQPAQMPGGFPGQQPAQMPGGFPGQQPAQMPGGMPGTMPPGAPGAGFAGQPDWNGTFVGNAGATMLVVQGGQGGYSGYIQDGGQQYQFQAHLDDETLHGELMANGQPYEFWADRDGTTVYLYLGDNTYYLELAGAPGAR
ncbi:MAG: hypothetical protein WC972_09425 [Trueperaceae bacterium]